MPARSIAPINTFCGAAVPPLAGIRRSLPKTHTIRIPMTRYVILPFKLGLSFGLVWYVFTKIDTATALTYLKLVPGYAIATALAVLLLQTAFASLRLRILLCELDFRFGFANALDAVFVGAFFSQTFISFVGGDAMRVWRIAKKNVPVNVA